jgi:tetratricopeptide (TPR) repeat protein
MKKLVVITIVSCLIFSGVVLAQPEPESSPTPLPQSTETVAPSPEPTQAPTPQPENTLSAEEIQKIVKEIANSKELSDQVKAEVSSYSNFTTIMINIILVLITLAPFVVGYTLYILRASIRHQLTSSIRQELEADIKKLESDMVIQLNKLDEDIQEKVLLVEDLAKNVPSPTPKASLKPVPPKIKQNIHIKIERLESLRDNNPKLRFTALDYLNIGNAYFAEGKFPEALTHYESAKKLKPDFFKAWINHGLALNAMRRYPEALESYERALKLRPKSGDAWNNHGAALNSMKRYPEALKSLKKAVEFEPNDYIALSNYASTLVNLKRYPEALDICEKALQIKPDDEETLITQGAAYIGLGDYNDACDSLKKLTEIHPNYHKGWDSYGFVLNKLGQYDKALEFHSKAIELEPKYASAYFNRACVYSLQKNIDRAITDLKKAIELDPKYLEQAKTDSDFDNIREDDRFKALIKSCEEKQEQQSD